MISKFSVDDTFDQQFKISEELVSDFVKLSNDRNPLHTIDEFAIDKGFKSRVVQGNLQNCFISYFIGECLPSKNVMISLHKLFFFIFHEPIKCVCFASLDLSKSLNNLILLGFKLILSIIK